MLLKTNDLAELLIVDDSPIGDISTTAGVIPSAAGDASNVMTAKL